MRQYFPSLRKTLAVLALAVGTLSVPAAPAFAADGGGWKAKNDDALLLDVRSGQWRVGDGVRGYQTDKGVCVDFGDVILALDLPVRLDKKSRRATGWLFKESRVITLDRDLGVVQIVNNESRINPGDIYDTPEGWCVDTQILSKWLAIEVTPDLSNSLLVLESKEKLPFELAEERKARAGKVRPPQTFDLSSLPQADDTYRFWRTPSVDVVASTGVRKDKLRGATFDARYEVYASGEVAGASFDARLSSDNEGVPERLRFRAYRTDPEGKLLGPLAATHFALGDVSTVSTTLGPQGSAGRGAYVTNRPTERPDSFDRTTFRGELPDGWDAELYRNDQLIGYVQSRGDGRYEFLDVPLLFGQNSFEVVLYGPQGQVRRDSRLIPVGLDSIPPRETYYWAGIQDAGKDLINVGLDDPADTDGWRGGFGLERGLDARTSIGAAFTSSQFKGTRRNYLEGSVRRALGPALLEVSAASDFGSGYALRGQALAQFGETSVSAEAALFQNGYQSERYELDLQRLLALSLDHSVRLFGEKIPVHVEARHRRRTSGDESLEMIGRLSFNINRINASTEIKWEQEKRIFGNDPPSRLDALFRLSGRIGRVRLRGESEFGLSGDNRGFRESRLVADYRAGDRSEYRLELGYNAAGSRGRVAAGYTRRFDKFALTGQLEAASDGSVAAGVNLAFSFGPDPRGGFRVASEKLAATGQALAIVYTDENGDGIRQPDETLHKEVELTAGLSGRGQPTDAKGATMIDGLQPFQPILIGIDESSLPDPFVQPATKGIVVTPRPGIPFVVELPLVAAGEIAGTLQKEGGRILSGVDIDLIDSKGNIVKTTRSEYDGFFLFEGVPYGKYRLQISPLAANIVGVDIRLQASAELNKARPMVELGIVTATSAARIADARNNTGGELDAADK
ncbi:MAG: carboxypeptidase regulatory-like domain-containing protein [Sphingomonadales bacterium]|nr:carboxypeptidase regulatory-like domain-containing protein [Sphingomonadales bacterium]